MKNIAELTNKNHLNLKLIIKGWVFLLLFFILLQVSAQAAIYTVGSGKTYATISACEAVARAGDTCAIYPGNYNERVTENYSGNTTNGPITYQAVDSSGNPVTCGVANPCTSSIVRGFTLTGQSYITIEGFEITHVGMTLTGTPTADIPVGVTPDPAGYDESIYMQGSNYIKIINNNINNTQDTCIFVHGHSGLTSNNLFIHGNTITHCGNTVYGGNWAGGQALAIVGNNNLIENNDISHIGHDDMDLEGQYNVYRNNNLHNNSLLDGPPGDADHLDTMQGGANIFPEVEVGGANYLVGDVLNILQSPTSDGNNPVSSALIGAGGSGYVVGDVLNVLQSGGTGATVTVQVINPVSTATVNNGGTGYALGDVLTLLGGSTDATVTVTAVSSSGVIQSVAPLQSGTHYLSSTGIATTNSGNGTDCIPTNTACGSGAKLNITGAIGGITLTTKGTGYTTAAGLATTGGTGSGATVNISNGVTVTVASVGASGNITGVTFKTGGQGYTYAYGLATSYLTHGPAYVQGSTPSGSGATFDYSAVGPTQYFLDENNSYSDAPSINQHFVIFQDQALPSLGSGNMIIRYNNVSNGGAFIVNNEQVTNVVMYNNSVDNMDEATGPVWDGIVCDTFYQSSTDGYTTGATGCQLLNNIYYNTVYNTSGGGGNEDQVDPDSQPGFFADYNLAYNSACGASCVWNNDCPNKGGNYYGIGCPMSSQEQNSKLNQNPLYNNAPQFGITIPATTTTGSINSGSSSLTVASASGLTLGEDIIVVGAGASGAYLNTTISAINGNVITLATTAGTSVTNAAVTGTEVTPVEINGLTQGKFPTVNPNNYAFNFGDNIEYNTDGIDRTVSMVLTAGQAETITVPTLPANPYTTSGSITSGSFLLTVSSASSFIAGESIIVAGAGANGSSLTSTISSISGKVLTLAASASTTVTNATVTGALSGSASDGITGDLTPTWEYTGPTGATVTFSPSANSLTPTATFSEAGSYVLTLTVVSNTTSQSLSASIPVTVVVNSSKSASNGFSGYIQGAIEVVNPTTELSTPSSAGNTLLDWGSSTNFTYDLSFKTGSPAIGAGGPLTTVASTDSGSGTSLIVNNAAFFQDGWNIPNVNPDWIAVGTTSNVVQIASINYATNTITLANPIIRNSGDSVWLYKDSSGRQVLYASAPNMGAYVPSYNLTVLTSGNGAVTETANNITTTATTSATSYGNGIVVTLTAVPASGSIFTGWSGGGCSGSGTCVVTMSSSQTVTATFSAISSTPLYGDVIDTGHVTIYDAELTAQYAIGLTVSNFIPARAKVDGNNNVDIYDAYLIAEYAIGLITKFSAVQP